MMFAVSPRSALKRYILKNPLTVDLNDATQLQQLVKDLPLPFHVKKVLVEHLYLVPLDGLFVGNANVAHLHTACRRDDLVKLLVSLAGDQRLATVVVVHGQRRTGKTFSMLWALTVAGCKLDADGRRRSLLLYIPCHTATALTLEDIPLLLLVAVSPCHRHWNATHIILNMYYYTVCIICYVCIIRHVLVYEVIQCDIYLNYCVIHDNHAN